LPLIKNTPSLTTNADPVCEASSTIVLAKPSPALIKVVAYEIPSFTVRISLSKNASVLLSVLDSK